MTSKQPSLPIPRTQTQRPRRGVSILECVTSLVMLSVLLTISSQMLVQTNQLARQRAQRDAASITLENAMERVIALPWDEIETAAALRLLNKEIAESGSDAWATEVRVAPQSDPVPSRRVTLVVKIPTTPGGTPARVALTGFVYPTAREEAP